MIRPHVIEGFFMAFSKTRPHSLECDQRAAERRSRPTYRWRGRTFNETDLLRALQTDAAAKRRAADWTLDALNGAPRVGGQCRHDPLEGINLTLEFAQPSHSRMSVRRRKNQSLMLSRVSESRFARRFAN